MSCCHVFREFTNDLCTQNMPKQQGSSPNNTTTFCAKHATQKLFSSEHDRREEHIVYVNQKLITLQWHNSNLGNTTIAHWATQSPFILLQYVIIN